MTLARHPLSPRLTPDDAPPYAGGPVIGIRQTPRASTRIAGPLLRPMVQLQLLRVLRAPLLPPHLRIAEVNP